MGAAFFQKGGVLLKLFEKSFTKNFLLFFAWAFHAATSPANPCLTVRDISAKRENSIAAVL
ncbi:hypothetical protein ACM0P6_11145 [Komagataeibacter sucrofermentans]|uniref:Uncharacterized protein n=1 Tax=Komagataeibacter sucrofermentans TaxID=1053551 RepID=A0A318QZL3_9PROT|nr:hypothetical protein [Komagataeibacter sucrofermentans]PYD78563.1 hypothetical protein CFR77_10935 [Komagataeibacter sucrofermentans]